MGVTQYIGARYVPIFADPAEWTKARTYEPLTIVLHEGNSYTSKQFVPVGIDINETKYWAETGNYNAQVEAYRQEVLRNSKDVKQRVIYFNTVDDMKESEILFTGALCHTSGFRTMGDGGAGWYLIASNGTENNMDIIKVKQGFANLIAMGDSVTPEMFGAYGNGTNDDSSYIERCIAFAIANKVNARLNTKQYGIAKTVNITVLDYVSFTGEGNRSALVALNASLGTCLNLRTTGDSFNGHKNFSNFRISCGGNNGIDAANIRYTTFEKMMITNADTGITTGNWCNRILNCEFIENNIGVNLSSTPINNVVLRDNAFSRCNVGLRTAKIASLTVDACSFDASKAAAIHFMLGCENANITNCYFEANGKDGYVTVTTAAGTTVNKSGTIIVHGNYSVLYSEYFRQLNINNCFFVNNAPVLIHASHLGGMNFTNNSINGTVETVCSLFWIGAFYTFAKDIHIDAYKEVQNTIDKVLDYHNVDRLDTCTSNITANLYTDNKKTQLHGVIDLAPYFTQLQEQSGKFDGEKTYKAAGSMNQYATIQLADTSLAGRLVTVLGLCKGIDSPNSARILLRAGDNETAVNIPAVQDWTNFTRNITFEIPADATTLNLGLSNITKTVDSLVTGIKLVY